LQSCDSGYCVGLEGAASQNCATCRTSCVNHNPPSKDWVNFCEWQ
jgi:hypothetical protein